MDRQILEDAISKGLTQRQIGEELNCSQSTVKHWLKKYGLKTLTTQEYRNLELKFNEKCCKTCLKVKDKKDFYYNSGARDYLESRCKACSNKTRVDRGKKNKLKIIEAKGGKCEHCGLTLEQSHYSVFDLHHKDPSDKDPKFNSFKFWPWERIKAEIDKCLLLCSNCHRIEHAKMGNW